MTLTTDFDRHQSVSPLQAASRFDHYFDVLGLSLKHHADLEHRTLTLIARSPASPPAQALVKNIGRFQPGSIEVRIIVAQIAPAAALNFMLQTLATACSQPPEAIVRWAKNRALLDAHERLTLGRTLCWTGDSMRRAEDSRSAIDRVDDGTPSAIAEANMSFAALWAASKPLPKTLLVRGGPVNMDSALQAPELARGFASGPNIVHLDEYLRTRRH